MKELWRRHSSGAEYYTEIAYNARVMMGSFNRQFWLATLAAAVVIIVVVESPMFVGKVPFPASAVFSYPPFARAAPEPVLPMPDIGDLVTSFYPYRTIAAKAVRGGELPLWNPYMLSGAPFVGNTQSAFFYPPNWLYYILPVPVAWSIGFILRILFAMVFTALFVRSMGGSVLGSVVSAILFALSGFMTVWQGQAMADAAIWLPLICFGIVRLHAEPSLKFIILLGVALSMPMLAGHPETTAHLAITAVALAAWLAVSSPKKGFVGCFVAASLMGIGLAAVQIVPTIEWLGQAYHKIRDPWPTLPLWTLLGLVSRDVLKSPNTFGLLVPEQAGYVGMLTFAAVPLAFLHRYRKSAMFWLIWTLAVLMIAFGTGPVFWINQHVPIVKALKNHRLLLVAGFGLAVLAGLGISEIETLKREASRQIKARSGVWIAGGFAIGAVLIYVLRLVTLDMSDPLRYPRISAFLLVLSVAALLLRLSGILNGAAFRIVILVVVCADMVSFASGFMPFTEAKNVFPPVELFQKIPVPPVEPFRLAPIGSAYGPNFEVMYGFSSVSGYELCLRRIKEFLLDLSEEDVASVTLRAQPILETSDRRLDMLNAKYYVVSQWDPLYLRFRDQPHRFRLMFSAGDTDVYENPKSLPPAFLVPASGIRVVEESEALRLLKNPEFDPLQSVLLERAEGVLNAPLASGIEGPSVAWTRRGSSQFELEVQAAAPSVLVVSQTFYPGWVAYIDDKSSPVFPADFALTGTVIPPGRHHVRFKFQSPAFRVGLSISFLTVVLILGLLVRSVVFKPRLFNNA